MLGTCVLMHRVLCAVLGLVVSYGLRTLAGARPPVTSAVP